jgi:hypothetical protein
MLSIVHGLNILQLTFKKTLPGEARPMVRDEEMIPAA